MKSEAIKAKMYLSCKNQDLTFQTAKDEISIIR